MQRPINPYVVAVVIGVVVLLVIGWFIYRGRQPAMPTKPEEAVTIPPSGMPGPSPEKMQEMQRRMQGGTQQGQ